MRAVRSAVLLVTVLPLSLLVGTASCGDLKTAAETDASSGAGPTSEASTGVPHDDGGATPAADSGEAATDAAGTDASSASSTRGPGPHGSLPSGYCCTQDGECRYRHCVDTGASGKMCLDECAQDLFCTRLDLSFTCDTALSPGRCKPNAGFTCLDPSTFTRGAKPMGACCNAGPAATNDGTAGSDCEGNQCASVGDGPLVCTNRCSFETDCIGGFACIPFGSSKACVPTAPSYTCK